MDIFGLNAWFWVSAILALVILLVIARYAPKKPIAKNKKKK